MTLLLLMLAIMATTTITTISAQEVRGIDSGREHFIVTAAHHDSVIEVYNVARELKPSGDVTKHIPLNITLKNSKVESGSPPATHKEQQIEYQVKLSDDTNLVVSMKTLKYKESTGEELTTQELTFRWPGSAKQNKNKREACFHMEKNVKW